MAKFQTAGTHGTREQEAAASAPVRAPRFTLKPSRQTCYALGGLMILVLVSTVGVYTWQSGEIAAIETQADQKRVQVASGEKVAHRLQEVETTYAETQGKLRFLETSVTPGEYVPTLLRQMESLAKSVNLKVAAVRPTLEPAPPAPPASDKEARKNWKPQPYDRLIVDMDVSGNYWSVAKLLYRLTEFPKIMTVETVQLTPREPKYGQSPALEVKMKVIGFIFPVKDTPVDGMKGEDAGATAPPQKAAFSASPANPGVQTAQR